MQEYCNDELCEAILCWSDDNPDFDTTYVEKLYCIVCQNHFLSEGQRKSLESIIESKKINLAVYV